MTQPCAVLDCPSMALGRSKTCGPHRDARTAKQLHIAKDVAGHGGKRCLSCRRYFREGDFVNQTTVARPKSSRPGDPYGYVHIACEPPSPRVPKKAVRESEKPLLEVG